jgi:hypothetical protein
MTRRQVKYPTLKFCPIETGGHVGLRLLFCLFFMVGRLAFADASDSILQLWVVNPDKVVGGTHDEHTEEKWEQDSLKIFPIQHRSGLNDISLIGQKVVIPSGYYQMMGTVLQIKTGLHNKHFEIFGQKGDLPFVGGNDDPETIITLPTKNEFGITLRIIKPISVPMPNHVEIQYDPASQEWKLVDEKDFTNSIVEDLKSYFKAPRFKKHFAYELKLDLAVPEFIGLDDRIKNLVKKTLDDHQSELVPKLRAIIEREVGNGEISRRLIQNLTHHLPPPMETGDGAPRKITIVRESFGFRLKYADEKQSAPAAAERAIISDKMKNSVVLVANKIALNQLLRSYSRKFEKENVALSNKEWTTEEYQKIALFFSQFSPEIKKSEHYRVLPQIMGAELEPWAWKDKPAEQTRHLDINIPFVLTPVSGGAAVTVKLALRTLLGSTAVVVEDVTDGAEHATEASWLSLPDVLKARLLNTAVVGLLNRERAGEAFASLQSILAASVFAGDLGTWGKYRGGDAYRPEVVEFILPLDLKK